MYKSDSKAEFCLFADDKALFYSSKIIAQLEQ